MADKWYDFAELLDRDSLKYLLLRHDENLTDAGEEIGCSPRSIKTAMEKHCILTTKERETATREGLRIRRLMICKTIQAVTLRCMRSIVMRVRQLKKILARIWSLS